jgi:hypothetical protein
MMGSVAVERADARRVAQALRCSCEGFAGHFWRWNFLELLRSGAFMCGGGASCLCSGLL